MVPVIVVLFSTLISHVSSYCWEPGRNPGFTGPPKVEQIDMATVRVSWEGLVTQRECADQFLVKYWQRSNPQSYLTSELLDKNANFVDVKVTPKIEYQFQAVAREDKGPIVGIDWNKSPLTDFKTSHHNKAPPPPAIEQPVVLAPTSSSILSPGDKPASTSNGASAAASPTSETMKEPSGILPMSIEVLAIVVVIGVAVLLVFVGVAYRLFCAKTGPVDEESCAGDEHEGHDDDDDDDSDPEEKERLNSTNSS